MAIAYELTDNLQPGGLWQNGIYPKIDLPKDAKPEDVIDAEVNNTLPDGKAYRVLSVKPLAGDPLPGEAPGDGGARPGWKGL